MANAAFTRKLTLTIANFLFWVKPARRAGLFQKFGWKFKNRPACNKIIKARNHQRLRIWHNKQAPNRAIGRMEITNDRPVFGIGKKHPPLGVAKPQKPLTSMVENR